MKIQIDNLTKSYKKVNALKNINIVLSNGIIGLHGPNGAGKSTLIKILVGLESETNGEVSILEVQAKDFKLKDILGYVPQSFSLPNSLTGKEFLDYMSSAKGIDRQEAKIVMPELLDLLNLSSVAENKINSYSGGMKQRLAIGQALLNKPQLLILDEPTAGVDIELRREMWTFLRELNANGTTIILTTHYLEEAEMLCRNIGIIQSGELIENTSMKSLLAKLQFETFIFDLAPYDKKPEITGFNYTFEDDQTLEVEVVRDQGINELFEQLTNQGIKVLSMRNKSNRLEELFLKITEENHV